MVIKYRVSITVSKFEEGAWKSSHNVAQHSTVAVELPQLGMAMQDLVNVIAKDLGIDRTVDLVQ